jgi:hypothetical protein
MIKENACYSKEVDDLEKKIESMKTDGVDEYEVGKKVVIYI